MAVQITKKFRHSNVVMLTSSATIIENAITHKAALIAKRATWADPFLANQKTRLDTLIQTFLGVDSAKALRTATQTLHNIQANAIEKLVTFKTQIDQDFKKIPIRKDEVLNILGFATYYADATKSKSQDALISLLYQFKKNMDATLKTEITTKGTDAASIVEIIGFADTLNAANINQETFKSNRPTITEQSIIALNDFYDDIIAISKISARIFTKDKVVAQTFSYSKLVAAQKAAGKPKKSSDTTPKPPTH